jgi:hypothetical protein
MNEMIGFSLVNLIVPTEPDHFSVRGPTAAWDIDRTPNYQDVVPRLSNGVSCAETYHAVAHLSQRRPEAAFEELRHLCLVFSYLTGSAVTVKRSVFGSEIALIQAGDGFPRERGLSHAGTVTNDLAEFSYKCEEMVRRFSRQVHVNHIDLIIHYLMDAFTCWSLEDLLLSAFTIMEMIQQNERKHMKNPNMSLYDSITNASKRLRIGGLSRDFHKMRQDLIHEGRLSANRFVCRTKAECANVCLDMLNWIDKYIHKLFALNVPRPLRHLRDSLSGLNSYSVWRIV